MGPISINLFDILVAIYAPVFQVGIIIFVVALFAILISPQIKIKYPATVLFLTGVSTLYIYYQINLNGLAPLIENTILIVVFLLITFALNLLLFQFIFDTIRLKYEYLYAVTVFVVFIAITVTTYFIINPYKDYRNKIKFNVFLSELDFEFYRPVYLPFNSTVKVNEFTTEVYYENDIYSFQTKDGKRTIAVTVLNGPDYHTYSLKQVEDYKSDDNLCIKSVKIFGNFNFGECKKYSKPNDMYEIYAFKQNSDYSGWINVDLFAVKDKTLIELSINGLNTKYDNIEIALQDFVVPEMEKMLHTMTLQKKEDLKLH